MISLITPNYNGSPWLDECLKSVAEQTTSQKNIEMILVDDGSSDNSRDIVAKYGKDIPGLRPIWHGHTGKPGAIRNLALDNALGEQVLFLDSDDYLGVETIERLSDFADETHADITAFQLVGLDRKVPTSMLSKTISDADIVRSGLYKTLGTWKMCRRDFLQQSNIRFDPSVGRGEDLLFFAEAMLRAERLSILSGYPFYTVRGREDGSSITQNEWEHNQHIDVARRVGELAEKFASTDTIANHFYIRIFNTDTLAIISDSCATDATRKRIKNELGKYWSPEVARLIYTDDARKKLTAFFEED